jgi:hypothetical protein
VFCIFKPGTLEANWKNLIKGKKAKQASPGEQQTSPTPIRFEAHPARPFPCQHVSAVTARSDRVRRRCRCCRTLPPRAATVPAGTAHMRTLHSALSLATVPHRSENIFAPISHRHRHPPPPCVALLCAVGRRSSSSHPEPPTSCAQDPPLCGAPPRDDVHCEDRPRSSAAKRCCAAASFVVCAFPSPASFGHSPTPPPPPQALRAVPYSSTARQPPPSTAPSGCRRRPPSRTLMERCV